MTDTAVPAIPTELAPDYQIKVSNNHRPPIAVDLLLDLVAWAEQDDARLAHMQAWGRWNQGTWSNASIADPEVDAGWEDPLISDPDGDQDIEDEDAKARQAILRGVCGTSFCMAGQAAHQAGYRMVYANHGSISRGVVRLSAEQCIKTEPTGFTDAKGFPILRDVGQPVDISEIGAQVLGLDDDEAQELFGGDNTIGEIKGLVNRLCTDRDLPVPFVGLRCDCGCED
jgi:hypothetical protein